jgi:hypothetical protein
MFRMKKLLFIVTFLISIGGYSQGVCLNNIDFEHGDSTGWVLTSGDINYVNLPCNTCSSHPGSISRIVYATSTIGTQCTNGIDNCTGIPVVPPNGGTYALLLNDNNYLGKMQQASKSFIVNPTDTVLSFRFMPVLEDGGHPVNEQPYFSYFVYDSTAGALMPGTTVIVNTANTSLGWQTSACAGVFYLPWASASINLSSVIGHNISLNFVVSDCNQGGHYGYAYIDVMCSGILSPCGGVAPASICFVTVDSSLHNEIYFNHSSTSLPNQGTIIYRKNASGTWDSLGMVPVTQPDKFIDTTALAGVQSYTYCLAATDSCHSQYSKSNAHKTIFLQSSIGTGGKVNLSWSAYSGLTVGSYHIFRGHSLSSMVYLAQVSPTTFTYTDLYPPVGNDYYKITFVAPTSCTSNAPHDTIVQSNYSMQVINCNNYISLAASLCFVTVDDSIKNEVYFNHSIGGLEGTIIYRQNSSMGWDSIGFVVAGQPDKFIDTSANPNQQSYVYCMEQIDSCGYHHGKSPAHTTILLQTSLGTGSQINLSWNAYIGISFTTYYIFRGTSPFTMTLLTQVSSSTLAYTDLSPLSGNNFYKIDIKAPTNCTSNAIHDTLVGSNFKVNSVVTTGINSLNANGVFTIYPNPANDNLIVNSATELGVISISNSLGEIVLQMKSKNTTEQIDISKFTKGIYFIQTQTKGRIYTSKFVKE